MLRDRKMIVLLPDNRIDKNTWTAYDYEIPDFPFFNHQGFVDYAVVKSLEAEKDSVTVTRLLYRGRYPEMMMVDLRELENASLIALAEFLWKGDREVIHPGLSVAKRR